MVSTFFGQKFSIRTLGQDDFQPMFDEHILGCPGTEVRIKGDRISGLVHPNIQTIYK